MAREDSKYLPIAPIILSEFQHLESEERNLLEQDLKRIFELDQEYFFAKGQIKIGIGLSRLKNSSKQENTSRG